jgi:DNA replication and repair protein RecF
MYLTRLSLTNFRAFTRLDMDVPRRILLLAGDNAQGKTSLLEAVYFMAAFTSVLAESDRQLISFSVLEESQPFARMVADFVRGGKPHRLEVRVVVDPGSNGGTRLRKEILVDGVKRSVSEALGSFTAVIFLPQMMRIVEGGPDERRRYLNLALSQAIPGYAQVLRDYDQVLSQRNALLKQIGDRGGDLEQLSYWDDLLTQKGSFLIHTRIGAVHELELLATRKHHNLTHSNEILRLVYQPSYDPLPIPEGQIVLPFESQGKRSGFSRDQIRQGFAARLVSQRKEEIARGVTISGPHRDELRLIANRVDLGDYGSRGQVRTALLALKLAEVAWLKEKTGHWPVLLLDETLVELDNQRRNDLLEALNECEQALLTTTDLNLFLPEFCKQNVIWHVAGGRIFE